MVKQKKKTKRMSSKHKQAPKLDFDTTKITLYQNTKQEIIAINEDKLRLILKDYEDSIKVNTDWQTPLGLFISILTTLLTADFHDFLGLTKAVWQAIFVIVLVYSLYLLITRVCNACNKEKVSIDEVVRQTKCVEKQQESNK